MRVTTLPLAVTAYTATSALGLGLGAHLDALDNSAAGCAPTISATTPLACWIGRVDGIESSAVARRVCAMGLPQ